MKPRSNSDSTTRLALMGLLARLVIGGLFIYMGLSKALDPVGFLKLIRQYDLVQHHLLLNLLAASLPWFEVFCGILLLSGIATSGAALLSLLMLAPFTTIVLQRALTIHQNSGIPFCAVRFDCGCGAGEVAICYKLLENGFLIALAALLLFWPSQRFSLRPRVIS